MKNNNKHTNENEPNCSFIEERMLRESLLNTNHYSYKKSKKMSQLLEMSLKKNEEN